MRPSRILRSSLLLGLTATACTSTYTGRWMVWNFSDADDHERFPKRSVEPAPPAFRFIAADAAARIDVQFEHKGRIQQRELDELARATHTTALIVVKSDTLLFEGYYNGASRESISTSFSVAKSITSLLVGIAIDRGWIGAVSDPVTRYVPELAERDVRFERLTIEHLLDMKSGLRWRDHDFLTGDKARAYYHPHLRHVVLREIGFASEPGERWVYNSYNPILLGIVLERATRRNVAKLLEGCLWQRLGMEYPASWSVDGTREPIEKMESGVNARAIDFAKIGRLVLEAGWWEGQQIVSTEWIAASSHTSPGCALEAYRPREVCYVRGWWVYPEAEAQRRAIVASGHLGQYVAVFPDLDLVVVRFGRKDGGVVWPEIFRSIADVVAERERLAWRSRGIDG